MVHITTSSVVLRQGPSPGQAASASRTRSLALAAAAATAGASVWALQQPQQHRPAALGTFGERHAARRKPKVSWLAVDALSGAIGEVASLVILYPLDSLKVLCQAKGASTGAVLAELRALGCTTRALRQLYAGCGSAALCSAAIGAVYLLAFYSAKRLGATLSAATQLPQQQQSAQQQSAQQQRRQPAGKAGAAAGTSGSQLADGSTAHPPLNSEGTHPLVASLAGVAASLAGSIFEAPMEMFKLRTQAGALDGPMLTSMLRAASTGGLGSLYATYGAFMLKSIPYDVAELATYSQMCDWREAAAARAQQVGSGGSSNAGQQQQHWQARLGHALAQIPDSASDMLIGAAAGVASVLVSMPCDVIKTRMDLSPPHCPPGAGGLWCSTRAFLDTGRQIVAQGGGPHALFVGVAPRLLQTVPSCMVYWAAVEGTRRLMQQYFEVDGAPVSDSRAAAAGSLGGGNGSSSSSSSPADAALSTQPPGPAPAPALA